ncbi:MAG TPA: GNAT family N-acetyltransferase [Thermoanaerobaculia bacterium]
MTETATYREADRSDRDAILALRRSAFAGEDAEKQQIEFWDWEFGGYAGAARTFVAETAGRIVAHIGFIPQQYSMPETVAGALAVDAMTHPEYRRRSIFSKLTAYAAQRLRSEFQVVTAFQIRPAVLPGMQAGGWRIAADCPILIRPLSIVRFAADVAHRKTRFEQRPSGPSNVSVRRLDREDLNAVGPLVAAVGVNQPRTRQFLEWRYMTNPAWRYDIEGAFEERKLRAFVVHRPTTLRGVRALAIADAGGDGASLRSLLRDVIRRAKASGASVAAALVTDAHPAAAAFRASGFWRGPHRFHLLVQAFDARLDGRDWSLIWGDTDHL